MRRFFPLLVLLAATAVQAQTVSRVTVGVRPQNFSGRCPAELVFIGTIHVNRYPVIVEYEWERSDGARGPRQRVRIDSRGRGVRDTWTLGARGEQLHVWEQLHVLAPTNIRSPRAAVRVNCR